MKSVVDHHLQRARRLIANQQKIREEIKELTVSWMIMKAGLRMVSTSYLRCTKCNWIGTEDELEGKGGADPWCTCPKCHESDDHLEEYPNLN